ncbi:MAG TPA: twin-arginine translocase subunit TatC [Trebonia sp.]|jgi:sec-independent protein translocase protein TatC|nr:twin-arginine translocase subunit TatC [Trebonia sp.]
MAGKPSALKGARIVGEQYARLQRERNPEGRMPLMDHLRELRNRVVKIALAVLAGAVVGWIFYDSIWNFLQEPFCHAMPHGVCETNVPGRYLAFFGVLDPFYFKVKIVIFAGAILTSPVWLYQLWAFIAPGLYSREKKWTYVFIGAAVPLFALGCFFAYFAMGRGLEFLMGMAAPGTSTLYTADSYLGYWIAMIIGFGLCFEVPLFLVMLNQVRIVTHERFKKWRRVIIFLIFVFAGIASPSPDPLTMLMLGGVVIALVEAAEIIIWFNDRRYARKHPDLYAGLSDDQLSDVDDPEPVRRDSSLN